MKIGTCGWSSFPEKGDRLLNYVHAFPAVEVNSTFYKLPMLKTAEKWRAKADSVNMKFEFTLKVLRTVTHLDRFRGAESVKAFEETKKVAELLRANFLVFQSPASFKPTKENIAGAKGFFGKIKRGEFRLGWEVRWSKDWTREIVEPLFEELELEHIVDPLRQESFRRKVGYYRLHGLGERMMYYYTFSDAELKEIAKRTKGAEYVFFNNITMGEDAIRFKKMSAVK